MSPCVKRCRCPSYVMWTHVSLTPLTDDPHTLFPFIPSIIARFSPFPHILTHSSANLMKDKFL